MTIIVSIVFFALLVAGTPVGFALAIGAVAGFLVLGDPMMLRMVPQRLFGGMSAYVLMAVPFFFLAGEIMNSAGITDRIVRFTQVIFAGIRGSLTYVNIVASMFFSGVTGAAVSDTAALGSMLVPAMQKAGFRTDFAAAVTVSSSVMGPIIPPSIIMVVYGSLMGESIGALFLAGLLPGIMIGIGLMIASYFVMKKRGFGHAKTETFSLRESVRALRDGVLAIIMPAIILGGILSGVFTPTEAAGVAAAYAMFLGFVVFRTLKLKDLPTICIRTTINTGVIFLILGAASVLSYLLVIERVPDEIAGTLAYITDNKYILLLLINCFLLVVGMFMEPSPAVILLGPILAPVAIELGIHPLHFAMVMMTNLVIGLVTPPVGSCLYVASSICRLPVERIFNANWPFFSVLLLVLLLVTYVPTLTTYLPRMFGYVG